jgi:tetratricopeptide (TPR) repeat protein
VGALFAHAGSMLKDRARGAGEFSKLLSRGPGPSHDPQNEAGTALPGPPAQAPAARAPELVPPRARSGIAGGTPVDRPTERFPSQTPKTLASASSSSTGPAVAAPASDRKSTSVKARQLRYEIEGAKVSLRAGRYTDAIYKLKRAIVLEPGNREVRKLLKRARAAQSKREESASLREDSGSSPAESAEGTDTGEANDRSEVTDTGEGTDTHAVTSSDAKGSDAGALVRDEMSEGDAHMRAGNYDIALRKFKTALVLDPANEDLPDRIEGAQNAKAALPNKVR